MSAIVTLTPGNWTEDELDQDGFSLLADGRHHIKIIRVKDEKNTLMFDYMVLNSTAKENKGLGAREYFAYSGGAMKKLWIFATRMGYRRKGEPMDAMRVDWETMVGQTLIVETKQEETKDQHDRPTGKYRSPWTFSGFWPLDDERVASVPRGAVPAATPVTQTNAQRQAANGQRETQTIGARDVGQIPW